MKAFAVEFTPRAKRDLASVPERDQKRIVRALRYFEAGEPRRGANVKKLQGVKGYRLRVGDYRVLYEVRDKVFLVLVVRVAHRREAYRK